MNDPRAYQTDRIDRRIHLIFNTIAPVYGKFHNYLMKEYRVSAGILDEKIHLTGKKVLDMGTGTGAWAASFLPYRPAGITGVDMSAKMIREAGKRHPGINFIQGNIEHLTHIPDHSFDIVTASFVVHGVKQDKRKRILDEMFRISKRYVVIQDFAGNTPFVIRVLEWLERSDYKHFKHHIVEELNNYTPHISVIPIRLGAGLYIAE